MTPLLLLACILCLATSLAAGPAAPNGASSSSTSELQHRLSEIRFVGQGCKEPPSITECLSVFLHELKEIKSNGTSVDECNFNTLLEASEFRTSEETLLLALYLPMCLPYSGFSVTTENLVAAVKNSVPLPKNTNFTELTIELEKLQLSYVKVMRPDGTLVLANVFSYLNDFYQQFQKNREQFMYITILFSEISSLRNNAEVSQFEEDKTVLVHLTRDVLSVLDSAIADPGLETNSALKAFREALQVLLNGGNSSSRLRCWRKRFTRQAYTIWRPHPRWLERTYAIIRFVLSLRFPGPDGHYVGY